MLVRGGAAPSRPARAPRRPGPSRGAVVALVLIGLAGCAPSPSPARWVPPSREELTAARAWLDALRDELGPRTEEVAMTIEAPLLPGAIRARGAVAIAPGRAARVVLLGPGGTTAADLWMDRARHRLAIPAREEVVRGERGDALRGMPLELFRTWFLEPLDGELLDASIDDDVLVAVLRTEDATVFVRAERGTPISAGDLRIERVPLAAPGARAEGGERDVETIHAPHGTTCGRVSYTRPRVGMRAEIACASRKPGVAERALVDPDRGPS